MHAKVHFEALTSAEGIPADYVFQILEDHCGFIWFTTRKAWCGTAAAATRSAQMNTRQVSGRNG